MTYRPMQPNDPRKKVLRHERKLKERLEALRYAVEHPNQESDIVTRGGVYRQKDPTEVITIKCDGVEVGYQVKPCSILEINPYFDRYVYLRVPGYKITDLKDEEIIRIKGAIYETFFNDYQSPIHLRVVPPDCLILCQRFEVAYLREKNKNLVSLIGGVNLDGKGGVIH